MCLPLEESKEFLKSYESYMTKIFEEKIVEDL